jgi:hypothetical protein
MKGKLYPNLFGQFICQIGTNGVQTVVIETDLGIHLNCFFFKSKHYCFYKKNNYDYIS